MKPEDRLHRAVGSRFGKLTVESTEIVAGRRRALCACDCGRSVSVRLENLVRGKTKTCGCEGARTRFHAVPPTQRFDKHWMPEPNSGCWLWTGKCGVHGYGVFSVGRRGRTVLAHRFSYIVRRGPAGDFHVCHRCDVRLCVNPDHLFLGTDADNQTDKTLKGRAARKLTTDEAKAIRLDARHPVVVANEYGVSRSTIADIAARRTWRHI